MVKISIKTKQEIQIMAEGGHILAAIVKKIAGAAKVNVTTIELDALATDLCRQYKVQPAFLGFRGYPAALCASVNNIIVHGIPNNEPLKEGDILGLDMGIKHKGFYSDMAVTVSIGRIDKDAARLVKATKEALDRAVELIKPGVRLGDLGDEISAVAKKYDLGVIKELTGHGIGRELQENPSIPNYGKPKTGEVLIEGMTIAIEPMSSLGGPDVATAHDNWSITLKDQSPGAHFEHTLAITKSGCQILTK